MTPFELVSKHVIPHLRALAAARLIDGGMSQSEVARRIGVTQPMVRRYYAERTSALESLIAAGMPREAVEPIAEVLAEAASRGHSEFLSALSSISASLLGGGSLCSLHRRVDREVPASCTLCFDLFRGASDQYLKDVENALAEILESPGSHELIPEVGMNIALAPPGALSVEQVVGIPGRIVRVGTRAVAVGRPAYGGSRHTASVALWAGRLWGFPRAAVAARYDESIIRAAEALGMRVRRLGEQDGEPDVVVDLGGQGVEPIAYFLGRSATEAVRKAMAALRASGGGRRGFIPP